MASLSFRDRFFSPPVGRALTSPSGILAAGAGAGLGILATIATGGLAVPIAGVVGALLGYGTRVAVAIPRKGKGVRVDPFGVGEPWRHAVRDAIHARTRYTEALHTFRAGPLQDSLRDIGGRLDEAIEQCWIIAQQGDQIAKARRRIDVRDIRWQLDRVAADIQPGGQANETQAKTVASLNAQLETAQRMDALMASTNDQLGLINARLDETVTQAIELSVTNGPVAAVDSSVEGILDSLTALRKAMGDVNAVAPGSAGAVAPDALGAQVLDVSGPSVLPPPPPPPAATETDPPGQGQAAPGT